MVTTKLKVDGMMCQHNCGKTVANTLAQVSGAHGQAALFLCG